MPKIRYESWKPGGEALDLILRSQTIAADYQRQGYSLTLRQLYYRLVASGVIPNTDRSYKRLGSVINKARMAGLFDWQYIVDRTRNLSTLAHWQTPAEILDASASQYREDKWADQDWHVEVWVEKEALADVVGQVARRLDVGFLACRGYMSQSEQWEAGRRFGRALADGKRVAVIHLGDHDPSGIDMTRDIRDRLHTFAYSDWANRHAPYLFDSGNGVSFDSIRRAMASTYGYPLDLDAGEEPLVVRRIALNMDQVEEYDPPPNPAKLTDSRVGPYIERFGDESWELDALDPAVLDALVDDTVAEYRDEDRFEAAREHEQEGRAELHRYADDYRENH